MKTLDCENESTTLASLAEICEVPVGRLISILRDVPEPDDLALDEAQGDCGKALFAASGLEAGEFTAICGFHAGRCCDASEFTTGGILPRRQARELFCLRMREFFGDEVSEDDWRAAISANETSRRFSVRTDEPRGEGPFGFFTPHEIPNNSHLFQCGEAIRDILDELEKATGRMSLRRRYENATRPCLVKFRSTDIPGDAIPDAVRVAWSFVHDVEIHEHMFSAIICDGQPVPAHDVLGVTVGDLGSVCAPQRWRG